MYEGHFKCLNFQPRMEIDILATLCEVQVLYFSPDYTFLGITFYWVDNFEKGFPKCEKNSLQTNQNIYPSPFESVIHPAYQAWLAIETFSPHTGNTSVQYPYGYVAKKINFSLFDAGCR